MPTAKNGMVKRMLRSGKAVVAIHNPFTIRLTYKSKGYTQAIELGLDKGSNECGLSATTETEELYAAKVLLRTDVSELIETRAMNRAARRARKTRYRAPRFDNRKRPEGWLPPSIRQRLHSILKAIDIVYQILPITSITVELAAFDTQKINNPDIKGVEYQQGEQLGFANVRAFVMFRDGHQCRHCDGKSKDKILEVHHLESRKTGGDAPNNLVTLCRTCHKAHHAGEIKLNTKLKRGRSLRSAAFMNVTRWPFLNLLKEKYGSVNVTYGYITKHTRVSHGLEKDHCVDARCISGNPLAKPLPYFYLQKVVRKNNRQLHKMSIPKGGKRKANKGSKVMHGYRIFDKVRFNGQVCFIFARRTTGYFDLRLLDGTKIHASASVKNIKLLEKSKTLLTERRMRIPPPLTP